jgi:endonuclease/exonuclease/phosphatase family metal-dependent hydrolase
MKKAAGAADGGWAGARWLRACVWLLALGAPLFAGAETLTIATYNIENYVATNRMADGVYRKNYPKPETEKAALRGVIRGLDADVIALQEVGPLPYLEELLRDLKSEGVDYPYFAWMEGADTERHLAVLSRRPFIHVNKHADIRFKYFTEETRVKRGLLEVRIAFANAEIALFVVHLKSRFTDRADDPESARRRAGEAEAIRDLICDGRSANPDMRFLVVGDCNDAPGSRPLRALLARGKTTITQMLPASDFHGETWTHFYRKQDAYSRMDYVLVSPLLRPWVAGDAAEIFGGPDALKASDHRPVLIRLKSAEVAP